MDGNDLWAMALTMAKPVVRLSAIPSGPAVGCFRGPALEGVSLPGRHLISFDWQSLPADLSGALSGGTATLHDVSDDDGPRSEFAVLPNAVDFAARPAATEAVRVYSHLARAADDGSRLVWDDLDARSVPLYAHPDRSLPNVADLLEFGPPPLDAWLRSIGWDPSWRYNGNLDRRSQAAADYQRLWWRDCYGVPASPRPLWPLPRERTLAVLGGWPVPLVDGELPQGRVILTVFAEEEPRRQVVLTGDGQLEVMDQTT